jgi:hypothetical protein
MTHGLFRGGDGSWAGGRDIRLGGNRKPIQAGPIASVVADPMGALDQADLDESAENLVYPRATFVQYPGEKSLTWPADALLIRVEGQRSQNSNLVRSDFGMRKPTFMQYRNSRHSRAPSVFAGDGEHNTSTRAHFMLARPVSSR